MQTPEVQSRINENMQSVRVSNRSGSHIGCFRCNPSDSDLHIYTAFNRWLEYRKLGTAVITEAIFNNGQRADILLPSIPLIEEIMVTETNERLEAKNYPFPIKQVKAKVISRKTQSFLIGKAATEQTEILIEAWEKGEGYNLIIRRTNGSQIIALAPIELEKLKNSIKDI